MANYVPNSADTQENKSKLETKHYLLLMFAVVFAVIPIFLGLQSSSTNTVAVPEEGIYVVGEKMTHSRTMTFEVENNNNSIKSTTVIEVLGFDGENYSLEQTTWTEGQKLSITMKTNLKGETVELLGTYPVDPDNTSSSFPVYGDRVKFITEKPKVGDRWSMPLVLDQDNITVQGTINYIFSETTTVTVPAGTYDVMKIEAKISDFESSGIIGGQQMDSTRTVTGYILLEESTHKVIEYKTVDYSSIISGSQIQNGTTTTFDQLVEHTK